MRFEFPPLNKLALGIIIVNCAVWLFFIVGSYFFPVLSQEWSATLSLQPSEVISGHVYKLVTYMFLHDLHSPFHLIFNMLLVYFFSSALLQPGSKIKAVGWCLLSGIVGGLFCIVFWGAGQWLGGPEFVTVIGFSGVAMFLLALYCLQYRDATIMLFFVLPMKAMTLLYIALGIDFLVWISLSSNVAFPAHLGGVLTAFFYYLLQSKGRKKQSSKYRVRML